MAQTIHLVYCRCAYHHALPDAAGAEVLAGLAERGVEFHIFDDLCELAARKDGRLMELADGAPVRIAACYPRAVRSMLVWAGLSIADLKVFNMRQMPAEQVLAGMTGNCQLQIVNCQLNNSKEEETTTRGQDVRDTNGTGETYVLQEKSNNDQWQPWFPVIDPDRCINCGQCLNFCLFGVYAKADGKVRVNNPDKCKNNCPACARVCPTSAIIFPKYPDPPINGDEVRPEDIARQKMQSDPSAISKGDAYSMLRNRSPLARAIQERAKSQNKQEPPANE